MGLEGIVHCISNWFSVVRVACAHVPKTLTFRGDRFGSFSQADTKIALPSNIVSPSDKIKQ